jgi:hypothetical protein
MLGEAWKLEIVDVERVIYSNRSNGNRAHRIFSNNVRLKERAAKESLVVNYQMNVPGYSGTITRMSPGKLG